LISRYRPRGVKKGTERWTSWEKRLAPSVPLVDAWYGKKREGRKVVSRKEPGISWEEYRGRFRTEMKSKEAQAAIEELRARVEKGETVTLLCFCEDGERCHRSLVRELVLRG
jgi:uncharacterized protein YeaO (DUF488 family)